MFVVTKMAGRKSLRLAGAANLPPSNDGSKETRMNCEAPSSPQKKIHFLDRSSVKTKSNVFADTPELRPSGSAIFG